VRPLSNSSIITRESSMNASNGGYARVGILENAMTNECRSVILKADQSLGG